MAQNGIPFSSTSGIFSSSSGRVVASKARGTAHLQVLLPEIADRSKAVTGMSRESGTAKPSPPSTHSVPPLLTSQQGYITLFSGGATLPSWLST